MVRVKKNRGSRLRKPKSQLDLLSRIPYSLANRSPAPRVRVQTPIHSATVSFEVKLVTSGRDVIQSGTPNTIGLIQNVSNEPGKVKPFLFNITGYAVMYAIAAQRLGIFQRDFQIEKEGNILGQLYQNPNMPSFSACFTSVTFKAPSLTQDVTVRLEVDQSNKTLTDLPPVVVHRTAGKVMGKSLVAKIKTNKPLWMKESSEYLFEDYNLWFDCFAIPDGPSGLLTISVDYVLSDSGVRLNFVPLRVDGSHLRNPIQNALSKSII
jgi:hypothetical protein